MDIIRTKKNITETVNRFTILIQSF